MDAILLKLQNLWVWVKANWIVSVIALIAIILFMFPKVIKKLFGGTTRRRRRRPVYSRPATRRRIPRSVGLTNKNRSSKKPWQIKGSEAARRHMAKLRRMK